MSELLALAGSEGYGACSDEAAAPPWSLWKARSCPAWPACWKPKAFYQKSADFDGLDLQGAKPCGAFLNTIYWGGYPYPPPFCPHFQIFRCKFPVKTLKIRINA